VVADAAAVVADAAAAAVVTSGAAAMAVAMDFIIDLREAEIITGQAEVLTVVHT
jgi:hypothetical protein